MVAGSGNIHNTTILLVEDHADTRDVLARLLERSGYTVRCAGDVSSALGVADRFDLACIDIGLPDASGVELLQALRQRGPVTAVALTGFGMADDLADYASAGFARCLVKPVSFDKLLATVRELTAPAPA